MNNTDLQQPINLIDQIVNERVIKFMSENAPTLAEIIDGDYFKDMEFELVTEELNEVLEKYGQNDLNIQGELLDYYFSSIHERVEWEIKHFGGFMHLSLKSLKVEHNKQGLVQRFQTAYVNKKYMKLMNV